MARPKESRYALIKGNYWIHYPAVPRQGPKPDGDTVRFEPDNKQAVLNLPWHSGRGPNFNNRGNIAVATKESIHWKHILMMAHISNYRSPMPRDENLRLLGFNEITFFPDLPNKIQSVEKDSMPGFVIANGIEVNGRLLGLAYAGTFVFRMEKKSLLMKIC